MDANIGSINQVPDNPDVIIINKAEVSPNHALGLQDLYKAAFSQETPRDNFNEFTKNASSSSDLVAGVPEKFYEEKMESTVDKTDIIYKNTTLDDSYHMYTLKAIHYPSEYKKDESDKNEIKLGNLNFPSNTSKIDSSDADNTTVVATAADITTSPLILQRPFESFQTLDSNSVLDLDKGIHIQVVKVADSADNSSGLTYFDNREYMGDSQILQRYLNDAAFLKGDNSQAANTLPATESVQFLERQCDKSYLDDRGVGVSPEALGVRFEDCDFNSSDSFASTESIIPKNIKCPKCPKRFMFKSDLMRHDKYKHSVKPKLCCKFCNKEFASQQNLIFHEKSHRKRAANKCEMCKKTFKKLGFLVKHMMKKHSKSTTFSCGQCDKSFTSQVLLNKHCRKSHLEDGEKPFKCDICSKGFEKKQGLNCHLKAHSDELIYACNICKKTFTKICYLKNHQKWHLNEEKESHNCDTCGKDFKSLSALEEHNRKHTGEKPFTCTVCQKSFAYKAYFKVHIKKHSEIKPFVCGYCQKAFVTSTDLNKHERIHTKEKPYHCTNCNQDFSQQSNLITHWKKQRCSGGQTQETCTQTQEVDILDPNLQNLTLQNVNLLVDQSAFSQQPIVLTSIGSFLNSNAVPVILTQTSSVPYSISSITS